MRRWLPATPYGCHMIYATFRFFSGYAIMRHALCHAIRCMIAAAASPLLMISPVVIRWPFSIFTPLRRRFRCRADAIYAAAYAAVLFRFSI